MIRRWSPAVVAPPIAQYSHLVRVPHDHDLVWIAGQFGILPDGTLAGVDAGAQTRQIYVNLEQLLGTLGAGPQHLVKLFTMITGLEHLEGQRLARREVFDRWYPDGDYPANSLAIIAALGTPELHVEIEAIAAVPTGLLPEDPDDPHPATGAPA
ncbi:RidA family protein [Sphaerisporangium sp. TRM90804]|uniref:RidA family protein n=1 Tax=Sphaerisporangium sp. TRM90804 TaxID=3031113 RepID=UPI0024477FFB|nr:RidA family protein [Sphaerisporangium sp. TRM90804]MDH2430355.1 RidA family protein [Sphaerisporangium sp. TRM90804]